MPRVKFRRGPIPVEEFEGMQVILHIEKVNVELGEILCTVIAHNNSGTMKNAPGTIDLVEGKDWKFVSETVKEYKPPPTAYEELLQLIEAIEQHKVRI